MDSTPKQESHSRISPTAKLTAHMRADTDIPFSKEIDRLCDAEKVTQEVFGDTEDLSWMAGMLELRYKSLSEILKREISQRRISQVLEMAAGVLPRGILVSENPGVTYVETDLPEIAEEKKMLVAELDPAFLQRKNYSILPLNALDPDEFSKVTEVFAEGKVAVINEGLLPYLSVEEKTAVSKNIHALLKSHGGAWITPDLSNSGRMEKIIEVFPGAKITNKKLNELVGKDMRSNGIGGGKEGALEFYRNFGFAITEYKASEFAGHLVSLDRILDETTRDRLQKALDVSCVWVLEAI